MKNSKNSTQRKIYKIIEHSQEPERTSWLIIEEAFFNFLVTHPEVIKYINDDTFMTEIYQSLTNTTVLIDPRILLKDHLSEDLETVFKDILKKGNEVIDVSRSFRSAGGFVARIRNEILGTDEDYMDWYCSGPEAYLSERVARIYDEIGVTWTVWVTDSM
jgi:hypothetical protein